MRSIGVAGLPPSTCKEVAAILRNHRIEYRQCPARASEGVAPFTARSKPAPRCARPAR